LSMTVAQESGGGCKSRLLEKTSQNPKRTGHLDLFMLGENN